MIGDIMRKIILDKGQSPGDIIVFTGAVRDLKTAHPDYQIQINTCCSAIFENNPHITSLDSFLKDPDVVPVRANLEKIGYSNIEKPIEVFRELTKQRKIIAKLQNDKLWHYYHVDTPVNADGTYSKEGILFSAFQKTESKDFDVERYDVPYDDIHNSGWSGRHFSTAYHLQLEKLLGVPVPQTSLLPDIHLSNEEKGWTSQVEDEFGYRGKFWLICPGHKIDYPLKEWGFDNWQSFVDILRDRVQFVSIGEKVAGHSHAALDGVLDLVGKTDLRQLIRLAYHAQGAVCHVTSVMHLMAAWQKPCVVIAGGREPRRWEMYPNHRYLDTNGCLPCCSYDGCWLSGHIALNEETDKMENKRCKQMVGGSPQCMQMIKPERVAEELMNYYLGGMLKF